MRARKALFAEAATAIQACVRGLMVRRQLQAIKPLYVVTVSYVDKSDDCCGRGNGWLEVNKYAVLRASSSYEAMRHFPFKDRYEKMYPDSFCLDARPYKLGEWLEG